MSVNLNLVFRDVYGSGIRDRTGHISYFDGFDVSLEFEPEEERANNNIVAATTVDSLPEVKTTDKTFAECIRENVETIKQQAQSDNKPICVLWSGGIDSTVALAAFTESSNTSFYVGCNAKTAEEYPELYHKIKTGQFDDDGFLGMVDVSDNALEDIISDYTCVTGEFGDQIFGTDAYFKPSSIGRGMDYTKFRDGLLEPYTNLFAEELLDDSMKASLAECGSEITDLADFLWWWNFTLKWHRIKVRIHAGYLGMHTADQFNAAPQMHSIFNSDSMQQWAMSNRETNKEFIKTLNPKRYKWVAKEYIHSVIPDENYRDNKMKLYSLSNGTFNK